jgi:lantibiotic modifying enzyme
MISAEALARLTARAATLDERGASDFIPTGTDQYQLVETRLLRWAELGAKGDRDRLRQSLHWRGIDLARILPSLGNVSLSAQSAPAPWALEFAELLQAALIEHAHRQQTPPKDHRTAVMACFVRAAKAELDRALDTRAKTLVTEDAFAAMERSLLLRLTRLTRPVLDREYDLYARGDSRSGGLPETRARRFADRVLQPPVPNLFTEYPVLPRLLTLACKNWIAASLELLQRLAADHQAIVDQFCAGRDPGRLVDIQIGDADVHDGHREVLILLFADGFRVVYKPRSLALDHAFSELLDWLHRRGLSPAMRSPRVLYREGYGWAEFIAHRMAADHVELESFYRRMGALACIVYVMGATDLHNGNLIAHGGHPILIDLETLFHANPRGHALSSLGGAAQAGYQGVAPSVLQTVLLPLLHRAPNGEFVDLSALAAQPAELGAKHAAAHWLPVEQERVRQAIHDHATAIEDGFVDAYRLIQRHREKLLAQPGPLTAFAGCPIRVVLRDTAVYFHLLRQSIDPPVLRDAADREILLERLNHSIAVAETPPSFVDMVTREKTALWNLDVPRFMVITDATDLRDAAGIVAANVMQRTPLDEMRARVAEMSETDLLIQHQNVRYSLSAYFAGRTNLRHRRKTREAIRASADPAILIAAAERIGHHLLDEARSSVAAPPPWRGPVFTNRANRYTVGEAAASFADGGMGVAFFLAALFRVTGNSEWSNAATALSLCYLKQVTDIATYNGHIAGGLTAGVGGLLYAAAHIVAMTGNEEVSRHAILAASNLASRAVEEEREMSLGDGLAGTLLGIAAIQRQHGGASIEQALQRGATCLAAAKPPANHGLLCGRPGVSLTVNTIGSRVEYEPPETDLLEGPADWGEGSVGRAVAVLSLNRGDAHAHAFFDRLGDAPEACDDTFAFGTSGQADALAWAADMTGNTALRDRALRRMTGAAERAYRGQPTVLGGMLGEGLRMPGLLHGSAGIGYVMLRLAIPGTLPALAVLELPAARKLA